MRAGAFLLAAALVLPGCGGDEAAPSDPPRTGPVADAGRSGEVVETAEGADSLAAGDPRPLRSRIVRLVNLRSEAVVIYASAGREAVVLDSLAAGDSSDVNVESRAPRVGLRALAGGRRVAADSLDLTDGEPGRWAVSEGG